VTRTPAAFAAPFVLALALALHGVAAAAVADAKVARAAPDRIVVTWTDADPVDVYLADGPDADLAKAKLASDHNRKGRLELAVDPAARPYLLLKDGGDGAVVKVAERALPLEHGSNFRDLGGYPAADGKHVRWGRIYRSGGTPLLTQADVARVKSLGLADMVDLRSSEERSLAPSRIEGVRYQAVGYSMASIMSRAGGAPGPGNMSRLGGVYAEFPTLLEPQLRILFEALLAGDGAVAYNCSAGQDRTGFATALVLAALGVPRDVIIADYHLSTTYRRPEYEMPRLDEAAVAANPAAAFFARYQKDPAAAKPQPLVDAENRPLLQYAFEAVERRWGSVEAYLDKELGVDAADIARLRAMYLE
jgi:protein-tyrosine phosphatase